MKRLTVRLIIGASAYAVISHARGTLDVRLSAGRGAAASLRETAAEWRAKSDAYAARAMLAACAADVLEEVQS